MSTTEPSAAVDTELSDAVVAYLRGPVRAGANLEVLAAHAVRRTPEELLAEIQALKAEMYRVPVRGRADTVWDECRIIHEALAPRHPELSAEALDALLARYAWSNR